MLLFFEKIGKGLFFCAILPLLTVKTRVNNMEAIMRKIMRTVVIGATLLLSPCVMAGSDGVEHAMKMMNKSNNHCGLFEIFAIFTVSHMHIYITDYQ